MATRHPHMSFRDRVTTALFDDIYERDLEFDAKIIAEIERLRAIEAAARRLAAVDGEGPFVETATAWRDLRTALGDPS